MNNKKWYENIPDGGLLVNWLDSIIRIMSYDKDGCVFDDSGDCYVMSDIDYMRPLTAAEWWDFAPWKGMDSAPSGTHILLMDDKGVSGSGFIYRNDTGLKCSVCSFHPIKWLPLPTVDL